MILRTCARCGKIHANAACVKQRERTDRQTNAMRYRNTQRWRRVAAEVKTRDRYICRWCLHLGEWHGTRVPVEAHHIVAIEDNYELRDDLDNLITLCRYHHEQAERGAIDADDLRRLALEDVHL